VLQGGSGKGRYNTDADDLPFRQESYFFWAFGVHESDCFAAIDIYSGQSMLFPLKLSPEYAIWMGRVENENWFKAKYSVDHVYFHDDGKNISEQLVNSFSAKKLLVLRAENTDSGRVLDPANFPNMEQFDVDTTILYPIISDLRVYKTDLEIEVMRYSSKIANQAHMSVMRNIKPGMYEYQLESLFRHVSYSDGGCRHLSYTCICASGENGAILHYGHENAPNAKLINDGDICVFDMGPEYNCYASDVTCSFPANGKFTPNQKVVYEAVLKATQAVFEQAKPGVRWTDMHLLAEKIILSSLKDAGVLVGDVSAMIEKRLGAIFMPHGLGHFLGLDVHDVGGYIGDATPRSLLSGLKSLRTTRTLHERMVITIEPGCYFIDVLIDKAVADPELSCFINKDRLNEFRGIGGVRIEDDVVIWEMGNENLNADLPRTISEIEQFMATGEFMKA